MTKKARLYSAVGIFFGLGIAAGVAIVYPEALSALPAPWWSPKAPLEIEIKTAIADSLARRTICDYDSKPAASKVPRENYLRVLMDSVQLLKVGTYSRADKHWPAEVKIAVQPSSTNRVDPLLALSLQVSGSLDVGVFYLSRHRDGQLLARGADEDDPRTGAGNLQQVKISGTWGDLLFHEDFSATAQLLLPAAEEFQVLPAGYRYLEEIDGQRVNAWALLGDGKPCAATVPSPPSAVELPKDSVVFSPDFVELEKVPQKGEARRLLDVSGCNFYAKLMGQTTKDTVSATYRKRIFGRLYLNGRYRFVTKQVLQFCVADSRFGYVPLLRLKYAADRIQLIPDGRLITTPQEHTKEQSREND